MTKDSHIRKADGIHLGLAITEISRKIKKSFGPSYNRTYALEQLFRIKTNLKRRHNRIMRNSSEIEKIDFSSEQSKLDDNLRNFKIECGSEDVLVPTTNLVDVLVPTPSLVFTNLSLSQPTSCDPQPSLDTTIDINSWINELDFTENLEFNPTFTPEYINIYSTLEQLITPPIVHIPEHQIPSTLALALEEEITPLQLEIEPWVENLLTIPEEKSEENT